MFNRLKNAIIGRSTGTSPTQTVVSSSSSSDISSPLALGATAIVYLFVVYYVMYKTITGKQTGQIYYSFILFVPIVALYLYYGAPSFSGSSTTETAKSAAYFVAFLAAIYGVLFIMGNFSYILGAGTIILGAAITVVGLAMIYDFTKNIQINRTRSNPVLNWLGFIWKFIFYIPCLFLDFINYINRELDITPQPIWSLLVIEVCLLLALHYYPAFMEKIVMHDSKLLVNEPLYLNRRQMVGAVSEIFPKTNIPTGVQMYQSQLGVPPPTDGSAPLNEDDKYKQKLVLNYCAAHSNDTRCTGLSVDKTTTGDFSDTFKAILADCSGVATTSTGVTSQVKCTDVFNNYGAGGKYASITGCYLDEYDPTYKSAAGADLADSARAAYIRNYSVAFWVFMNPQPPNSSPAYAAPTNIFRIGKYNIDTQADREYGKPAITYFNEIDPANGRAVGKYRIYLDDRSSAATAAAAGEPTHYDLVAPEQKWNLFVLNFSNSIDVFLNGDLVITKKTNTTFPNKNDFFVVGEEGGLDGAICSAAWFPHPLTGQQIRNYYNSLKMFSPPVANIEK
jgi:hypothetical protein